VTEAAMDVISSSESIISKAFGVFNFGKSIFGSEPVVNESGFDVCFITL